jgi:hypothetical protein
MFYNRGVDVGNNGTLVYKAAHPKKDVSSPKSKHTFLGNKPKSKHTFLVSN